MTTVQSRHWIESDTVADAGPEAAGSLMKGFLLTCRIGATMAAVLAHRLRYLDATMTILCRGRKANAANPIELLYLDAYRGCGIVANATGPDSEEAIEVLRQALAEPWYADKPEIGRTPRMVGLRPTGTCG